MVHVVWRHILPAISLLLVVAVGCDRGETSKRDAQYEQLRGTWEVLEVTQGRFSYEELDVDLTFRETNGDRTYRLRTFESGDTSVVRGAADMIAANTLRFSGGFSYPLVWTFTFDEPDELSDTARFYLETTRDGRAEEFMRAIGLSGMSQRVEMDLEYQ